MTESDRLGGKDIYFSSKNVPQKLFLNLTFKYEFHKSHIYQQPERGISLVEEILEKIELSSRLNRISGEGQIFNVRSPNSVRPWQMRI